MINDIRDQSNCGCPAASGCRKRATRFLTQNPAPCAHTESNCYVSTLVGRFHDGSTFLNNMQFQRRTIGRL